MLKLASIRIVANNRSVIQEIVDEPTISMTFPLNVCSMEQEKGQQLPIMEYLTNGKPLEREKEAKAVKWQASFYTIMAGELYYRGYSQPLLKCISGGCARAVIAKMHEGICENHARSRALATKILQVGYFCPTMK